MTDPAFWPFTESRERPLLDDLTGNNGAIAPSKGRLHQMAVESVFGRERSCLFAVSCSLMYPGSELLAALLSDARRRTEASEALRPACATIIEGRDIADLVTARKLREALS